MVIRIATLTVDCANPAPIARWWAEALGWHVTYEGNDEVVIEPTGEPHPGDCVPCLLFIKAPDAKSAKNRLHLDLLPDDRDAEVARLEALGAKRIDIGQGPDVTWVVMSDPFENEFCVLRALRPDELS